MIDVLKVVGVGKATKKLSDFLDCTKVEQILFCGTVDDICHKEYRTTCLLGCETDTYDSEGARVRTAPWKHVDKEKIEVALGQFTGEIEQVPPMCVSHD